MWRYYFDRCGIFNGGGELLRACESVKFLIDSSGAIALLVYLVIAVHNCGCAKFCEQKEAKFACGLALSVAHLAGHRFYNLCVGSMLFRPAQQLEVISTGLLAIG